MVKKDLHINISINTGEVCVSTFKFIFSNGQN